MKRQQQHDAEIKPYTVTLRGRVIERGYEAISYTQGHLGYFSTRTEAKRAAITSGTPAPATAPPPRQG